MVRRTLCPASGAVAVREGEFAVVWAPKLADALERLDRDEFAVVLLNLNLPDSQGLETLDALGTVARNVPIVVLTPFDDDRLALAAIGRGAQDHVAKNDLDGRLLRRTIRHAIERKRAETVTLQNVRAGIEQQALALQHRADQLDRVNRELDDFTYIASHDLKEPLRGIAAYCQILLQDYHDKIDTDGQHRLRTLVELCNRLERLITDLLTYCRVGGTRPAETRIDLRTVAADVLDTLEPAIEQRNAAVHIVDPLPKVIGDATLIGTVFSNLVSNGLKFNDDPQPTVQIGCLPTEPPTLYVRDNGIGIPEKHHKAIFAAFRRLHGRQDYEGSGVGLTIAKKIVESHGGRIWVESQPGAGTTFYFTLPTADEKPPAKLPARPPHWIKRRRRRTRYVGIRESGGEQRRAQGRRR